MTESISRKELCGYLSLLRRQLAGQSLFPAPNVIFLNSRALYHHLARQTCGGITVGEILESSKADFLLLIHQTAENEPQWCALTALCEKLRQRNLRT